jgi:hypothetical protein
MRRQPLNVCRPRGLPQQVGDFAARRRLSKSSIIEAAVADFLSGGSAESREAAIARRLDLLTPQVQRLEREQGRDVDCGAFMRFFLTVIAPLPPGAMAATQANGNQRMKPLTR